MTNLFTYLSNWKLKYICALVVLLCLGVGNVWGAVNNGDLFERISAVPSSGDEVIIVNPEETAAMSTTQNDNNRGQTTITTSSNQYIYASANNAQVLTVKVDGTYYGFHTSGGSTGGFLQQPSNKNYLRTTTAAYSTALADATKWSLSVSSSVFTIRSKRNTEYYLQHNSSNSIFSSYKNTLDNPYIYKKVMSAPTAVAASSITSSGATITITDATNVNCYELYYGTSSTAPTASSTATTTIENGKSKSITGLTAGTNYYVWARAYSTSPARKTGWVALTGNYFTTSSASCSANPTIGDASLNGSISLSSFPLSISSVGGGTDCTLAEYGFVWKAGSAPSASDNKTKIGESSSATSFTGNITGSFSTGVTYYIKGYAINNGPNTTLSSTALPITPRSIEFNSNDGSSVSTIYVNSGTAASAPTAPTMTGYNFGGWYTDNGTFASAVNWSSTISENKTYYAKWTAKTTTISFNQNSGSGGQTGTLTATYDAAMPSAPVTCPTRTGYDFGGYYDGSGGTGTQYYTSTGASARTWNKENATWTLYAKWTIKTYSVTWKVNGEEYTAGTPTGNVNHGSHVTTLPTAPSTASYCGDKFMGWTDATDGAYVHGASNLYTKASDFPNATGNQVFYAVFADYVAP